MLHLSKVTILTELTNTNICQLTQYISSDIETAVLSTLGCRWNYFVLKWNSSKEIYNFCNFWPAQNYNSNFRSAEIVVTGNLKGRILWNRFFFSTWKSMCWLIEKNENWKMIPFYFPRFASLPLLLPQLSWKTLPVMWDDSLHVGKIFFSILNLRLWLICRI